MDYAQLNLILSDLRNIRYDSKKYQKITSEVIKQIDGDYGSQGDEGQTFEIYSTPIEGVYVKLDVRTDSYGDNEFVHGLAFVKPVEKVVQFFEPISN